MQRRRGHTWAGVGKTAQAAAAHAALFCFTLLLALRVDGRTTYSWWIIFIPLWLFHGIVARGRFSMPAPSLPHGRHWAPCHSIVAAPLLIAFELLLCIYLESIRGRCGNGGPCGADMMGSGDNKWGKLIMLMGRGGGWGIDGWRGVQDGSGWRSGQGGCSGGGCSAGSGEGWEGRGPTRRGMIALHGRHPRGKDGQLLGDVGEGFCRIIGGGRLQHLLLHVLAVVVTRHLRYQIDRIRDLTAAAMCRALMPGDEESMSDEAIWETLPHFWVAISMVFLIAATTFTLLKLSGDVGALGWWDLFINYGIAECFAFLVCTRWFNPMIHKSPTHGEASSSSASIRYRDWESGLVLPSLEDHEQERLCGLPDIGGHVMKIPLVAFQVLLCMRLEGTPPSARYIPIFALFSPLFILQGAGVLFSLTRLVEKVVLLLRNGPVSPNYLTASSKVRDCFAFLHRGSRLLGWWSIDEGSKEEQARLFYTESTGRRFFVGFATRERYAWCYFPAGTELYAKKVYNIWGKYKYIMSNQKHGKVADEHFVISVQLSTALFEKKVVQKIQCKPLCCVIL
uniref:Uncharacterized protein n=1 Tax=Coix lacryma-jobi TaxID=4505 RepID=G8XUM7_COILA|nr:putative protein [Coix lacryma-jobi]